MPLRFGTECASAALRKSSPANAAAAAAVLTALRGTECASAALRWPSAANAAAAAAARGITTAIPHKSIICLNPSLKKKKSSKKKYILSPPVFEPAGF